MTSPRTVLVIAAHADDEVLGCGATIALRVREGWRAHLLVVANGATSRHAPEARASAEVLAELENLKADLRRAAAILGFATVETLDFVDQELDVVPRLDVARAIDAVLERVRPDVLYTHHPGDYNWDHTRVFEAVLMAARPSPGEFSPSELYSFEVLSSTERAWQAPDRAFHPNVYVDVTSTIDLKKQALAAYRTECKAYPHPRSLEGVDALARKRGCEVGRPYAEAFALIRSIVDPR
jgi:LmbE family N-acetylglucosaminyl deacetylase